MKLRILILISVVAALSAVAQPVVVDGGVLNGASFAKDANGLGSPVGVGSLVSIFGTNLAVTLAAADTVPFSTQLGGVSVTFGGKSAAMRNVIPGSLSQLNVQIPFDVLASGQTSGAVDVVVTVNNVSSAPKKVSIVPSPPASFPIPPQPPHAVP